MKTTEKFAVLDAVIAATGMTEGELNLWLQKRQSTPDPTPTPTSTDVIKSILPVVYKKGNEFEILPHLDLNRKDDVWGYELFPGAVLAKKCGADGNVESTTWSNCKAFAKKVTLNGKAGALPSKEVLKKHWSEELRNRLKAMDKFLLENGVAAEPEYYGVPWCSEVLDSDRAFFFLLENGDDGWNDKLYTDDCDRLVVAFKR